MSFLFKDRDGQTPLPPELRKGLRQKHIQTIGELDEYEEDNIAKGILWLEKQNGDIVDYVFWRKLHRQLFGQVWTWAGKVRTHELNNPDFDHPSEIWTSFRGLESDVKYWTDNFTYSPNEIAARFHERIETIHPFANGNGRFGRILVEYFCKCQNTELPTWGASLSKDPELRRRRYIEALNVARRAKNYKPLIDVMFT